MTWWGWMIIGAILLGAELLAVDAQFYLVFLGLSAALVGLASLFGVVMPEWVQWTAFAALSLISFFTFRKSLYEKIRGGAVKRCRATRLMSTWTSPQAPRRASNSAVRSGPSATSVPTLSAAVPARASSGPRA